MHFPVRGSCYHYQTQLAEVGSRMNRWQVLALIVLLILVLPVKHAQADSGTSSQKYALVKNVN